MGKKEATCDDDLLWNRGFPVRNVCSSVITVKNSFIGNSCQCLCCVEWAGLAFHLKYFSFSLIWSVLSPSSQSQ